MRYLTKTNCVKQNLLDVRSGHCYLWQNLDSIAYTIPSSCLPPIPVHAHNCRAGPMCNLVTAGLAPIVCCFCKSSFCLPLTLFIYSTSPRHLLPPLSLSPVTSVSSCNHDNTCTTNTHHSYDRDHDKAVLWPPMPAH